MKWLILVLCVPVSQVNAADRSEFSGLPRFAQINEETFKPGSPYNEHRICFRFSSNIDLLNIPKREFAQDELFFSAIRPSVLGGITSSRAMRRPPGEVGITPGGSSPGYVEIEALPKPIDATSVSWFDSLRRRFTAGTSKPLTVDITSIGLRTSSHVAYCETAPFEHAYEPNYLSAKVSKPFMIGLIHGTAQFRTTYFPPEYRASDPQVATLPSFHFTVPVFGRGTLNELDGEIIDAFYMQNTQNQFQVLNWGSSSNEKVENVISKNTSRLNQLKNILAERCGTIVRERLEDMALEQCI